MIRTVLCGHIAAHPACTLHCTRVCTQGLSSDSSAKAAAALTEHALGWASAKGLAVRVNDPNGLFTTTHLPFSLLPNAIPRASFEKAKALAPLFNDLVDAISRDGPWLERVLSDVVRGDPFTAELLKVVQLIMLTFSTFLITVADAAEYNNNIKQDFSCIRSCIQQEVELCT
jgi:Eukaryotic glutathione synthase, ATP binding domain